MPVPRKTFPECPIERTLAVLSGRWKAMLVWHLLAKPRRYSELVQLVPEAPERVVTQALRELSDDGILVKEEEHWRLTPLGTDLTVALDGMYAWGARHAVAVPRR